MRQRPATLSDWGKWRSPSLWVFACAYLLCFYVLGGKGAKGCRACGLCMWSAVFCSFTALKRSWIRSSVWLCQVQTASSTPAPHASPPRGGRIPGQNGTSNREAPWRYRGKSSLEHPWWLRALRRRLPHPCVFRLSVSLLCCSVVCSLRKSPLIWTKFVAVPIRTPAEK